MSWSSIPRRLLWWLLALLWVCFIFWLSSSPDAQGMATWVDLSHPRDKFVHGATFGLLGVLLFMATDRPWLSILLASLYGLFDELHQANVPGRQADAWDWAADTLGALIAVGLVWYFTRRYKTR